MTLGNYPAGTILPLGLFSLSQLLTARLYFIVTLAVILLVHYARSPWRKVPPGPKGLPILGNVLQLQNKGWMFGKECKRKFGLSSLFFFAVSVTPSNLSENP